MFERRLPQLLVFAMMLALTACGGGEDPPPPASSAAAASPPSSSPPAPTSFRLDWNPNTEPDLAAYRIYRSTSSGSYGAPVATVPAGTTSFVATGLKPGVKYFFTITAVDKTGNESVKSSEVSGTL
jgi:fibronectin type 3 domain-containing protein